MSRLAASPAQRNNHLYPDIQVDSKGNQMRQSVNLSGQMNQIGKQSSTDPVKRFLGMQRHSPDQVKEDSALKI